jgi:hypothetical protein
VWQTSSPCTGVVVAVVVGVVVVGVVVTVVVAVVVGVVDSSLAAITTTLAIVVLPSDSVTVTPVLVIAVAMTSNVVDGAQQLTLLYALATSVVPKHVVVMLVIWSRRILPVLAMVVAISSFVRSEFRSVCGHEPAPKLTSTCCCSSFGPLLWHTAVVKA